MHLGATCVIAESIFCQGLLRQSFKLHQVGVGYAVYHGQRMSLLHRDRDAVALLNENCELQSLGRKGTTLVWPSVCRWFVHAGMLGNQCTQRCMRSVCPTESPRLARVGIAFRSSDTRHGCSSRTGCRKIIARARTAARTAPAELRAMLIHSQMQARAVMLNASLHCSEVSTFRADACSQGFRLC